MLLFQRRDLGATAALPARIPARRLLGAGDWSLSGPGCRSFAERLPAALSWGRPGAVRARHRALSGWAEDEPERRAEMVRAAPLTRLGWALRGGGAVVAALFIVALVTALGGTALGVAMMGDPVGGPISGALVLALYGSALAGIGLAVAGLGWPRLAGIVVAALAIGMYLLDLIGAALGLSPDVLNLALVRHLGQPMAGNYNMPGMLLSAGLALGGLGVGAIIFSRRDLR